MLQGSGVADGWHGASRRKDRGAHVSGCARHRNRIRQDSALQDSATAVAPSRFTSASLAVISSSRLCIVARASDMPSN